MPDLRDVYLPSVGADAIDLAAVRKEVERALPNEQERIHDALTNTDYYNGQTDQYIDYHESESVYDHTSRPKRTSNLTRRVVEILCEHLYNPGPRRRIEASPTADTWLQEQYEHNAVDALLHEADSLATLNDVAAIQVAALGGPGAVDDPEYPEAATPDAPLTFHLLGSEEFAVWLDPAQPTKPWAVCTVTRFDERRRFQLWTKDIVETYWTRKGQEAPSGRPVAVIVPEESGPNPYGCLPFAFIPYQYPSRSFWVHGPGTQFRHAHHYLDNRLSELALSIKYYSRPMGLAYNVREDFRPMIRPGGFQHVPRKLAGTDNPEARVEYLQAQIDIAGEWMDIQGYIDHTLEMAGVPRSAIRLEQSGAVSGVAIVAEQWPLITRTKARQRPFNRYEAELAKVALAVGGAYYGRADLIAASVKPMLQLAWPEVEISLPGPEKDAADDWELGHKLRSKIQVLMERRGVTRDQAIAELEQVVEDEELLISMGLSDPPVDANGNQLDANGKPIIVEDGAGGPGEKAADNAQDKEPGEDE